MRHNYNRKSLGQQIWVGLLCFYHNCEMNILKNFDLFFIFRKEFKLNTMAINLSSKDITATTETAQ